MLLFFIAQMTAWADSCKAENLNTLEMNYTIYMCNHGIEKEVKFASEWWNNRGEKLKVAEGAYNCNRDPEYGEIYIKFNDSKVKEYDALHSKAYGVTIRKHFSSINKTVKSSTIYLLYDLLDNRQEMQTFIVHEMGHAIGYSHVPESCYNYIMNPYISGMGSKL